MTLEQYKQYAENIKTIANAIFQLAKSLHKTDTGVYYSVNEILTYTGVHTQQETFIINELKSLGMESYNNNTEWRI
jgi:tRNA G26 N,N-dimethylase Trm1